MLNIGSWAVKLVDHGIGFGPNKVNFQNTEKLTQLVTLIIKMSKDFGNIGDIFMFLW